MTAHVYQIYIAATPEQVWTAITDSEWTRRYFHSTAYAEPLSTAGPTVRWSPTDGRLSTASSRRCSHPPWAALDALSTPGTPSMTQTWQKNLQAEWNGPSSGPVKD